MVFVFLDWEQAFNKIDKKMKIEALKTLNIPREIFATIHAQYEDLKFKVECRDSESDYMSQ